MGPEQGLMDCARSVSLLHVGKGLTLFFWKEGGQRRRESKRQKDTEIQRQPERVREEQSETRTGS